MISPIKSHRHLGVTFSTDAKWNAHIEHNRSNLEKLYLVSSANSLSIEVNMSAMPFIYIL
jgi:hypothetical protein